MIQTHEEKNLLMGYIDGELSQDDKERIEHHLAECKECAQELELYQKLNEIVQPLEFITLEDRLMSNYWRKGFRKIERNTAMFLLFAGLSILAGFGIVQFVIKVWYATDLPQFIKIAVFTSLAGGITLLFSIIKEKLFLSKKQRYSDIRR